MINIEIESDGAERRVGRIRTDFRPTPSAIIRPVDFGADETNDGHQASAESSEGDVTPGKDPEIPQIIRGVGPTIVMLPPRRAAVAKQ
jgi:hypothetical protein